MTGLLIRQVWGKVLAPSECHLCTIMGEGRGGEIVMVEEFGIKLRRG